MNTKGRATILVFRKWLYSQILPSIDCNPFSSPAFELGAVYVSAGCGGRRNASVFPVSRCGQRIGAELLSRPRISACVDLTMMYPARKSGPLSKNQLQKDMCHFWEHDVSCGLQFSMQALLLSYSQSNK